VEIYRRLAQDNAARSAPDVATTLNNLLNRLGDAGGGADALAASREAVEIRRRLAQDDPARFASNLERTRRVLETLEIDLRSRENEVARSKETEAELRWRVLRDALCERSSA
jgi:hypothetical protein